MKYIGVYTLTWRETLPEGIDRVEFEFPGGLFRFIRPDPEERRGCIEVEVAVDPEQLKLTQEPPALDGSAGAESIQVREKSVASELANLGTRLLSFLVDMPFQLSVRIGEHRLVPENDRDKARLAGFGSDRIRHDIYMDASISTPPVTNFTEDQLGKFQHRALGLALYADALSMGSRVGRYRELWRLLESAFGLTDDELVSALSKFKPAQDLGFDESELKQLLIIRGRASHAESRMGLEEYKEVSTAVSQHLPRLKTLARRVLLTKRTWGQKGTGVDPIAPLSRSGGNLESPT